MGSRGLKYIISSERVSRENDGLPEVALILSHFKKEFIAVVHAINLFSQRLYMSFVLSVLERRSLHISPPSHPPHPSIQTACLANFAWVAGLAP